MFTAALVMTVDQPRHPAGAWFVVGHPRSKQRLVDGYAHV